MSGLDHTGPRHPSIAEEEHEDQAHCWFHHVSPCPPSSGRQISRWRCNGDARTYGVDGDHKKYAKYVLLRSWEVVMTRVQQHVPPGQAQRQYLRHATDREMRIIQLAQSPKQCEAITFAPIIRRTPKKICTFSSLQSQCLGSASLLQHRNRH